MHRLCLAAIVTSCAAPPLVRPAYDRCGEADRSIERRLARLVATAQQAGGAVTHCTVIDGGEVYSVKLGAGANEADYLSGEPNCRINYDASSLTP